MVLVIEIERPPESGPAVVKERSTVLGMVDLKCQEEHYIGNYVDTQQALENLGQKRAKS